MTGSQRTRVYIHAHRVGRHGEGVPTDRLPLDGCTQVVFPKRKDTVKSGRSSTGSLRATEARGWVLLVLKLKPAHCSQNKHKWSTFSSNGTKTILSKMISNLFWKVGHIYNEFSSFVSRVTLYKRDTYVDVPIVENLSETLSIFVVNTTSSMNLLKAYYTRTKTA